MSPEPSIEPSEEPSVHTDAPLPEAVDRIAEVFEDVLSEVGRDFLQDTIMDDPSPEDPDVSFCSEEDEVTDRSLEQEVEQSTPAGPPSPPARKRDVIFDKIAEVFYEFGPGDVIPKSVAGRIAGAKADLLEVDKALSVDKLVKFCEWYRAEFPEAAMVRDRGKLTGHYRAFLKNPNKHTTGVHRVVITGNSARPPQHF